MPEPSIEVQREMAKVDRFRHRAEIRANKALHALRILEHTANKQNYSYTEEEAAHIVAILREGVDRVEAAYAGESAVQLRIIL